jgi:hypothetical protein
MSSARHATQRSEIFTGRGKRPDFIPSYQQVFPTGMTRKTSHIHCFATSPRRRLKRRLLGHACKGVPPLTSLTKGWHPYGIRQTKAAPSLAPLPNRPPVGYRQRTCHAGPAFREIHPSFKLSSVPPSKSPVMAAIVYRQRRPAILAFLASAPWHQDAICLSANPGPA